MTTSDDDHLPKPTEEGFREVKTLSDQQKYERRPEQGAPNWSLWELNRRLAESAQLYELEDLQSQRDAVATAIFAVHDYLSGRGFAPATLAPLMRPVVALVEREKNAIDLLFAERVRKGRPSATLEEQNRSGTLAALASFWLQLHPNDERKQTIKFREPARILSGPYFGEVTAANLKTARDLVMQEAKDHPAVIETKRFADTLRDIETKFGSTNAFSMAIRMLNDIGPMHNALKIAKTPGISPIEEG